MNKHILLLFAAAFALSTSGCYHAVVTTGAPPSDLVVEEKWVVSFVNGLIMVDEEIDVSAECPNGVAIVETKLSFWNQVVTGLTAGIFSPMQVTVTCAAGTNSAAVIMEGTDQVAVLSAAAQRSADEAQPLPVRVR